MVILTLLLVFVIGMTIPMVAGDISPAEKTKITTKAKGKTLYATLKTANNEPIAGKKIKFNVKGKNYYRLTNSKGVASVKISYSKMKNWKFKATFIGGKQYQKSSKTGLIPKPKVTITCKPSCGRCSRAYTWRTKSYVNYCPNCHKYDTLGNKHKRASRHEKEITCFACDSDFCGNCGKEKMGYSRKYLRKK